MSKAKYIIISLISIILLLIPSIVNATNSEITAKKVVDNCSGNIDFEIQNISLSSEGNYVWSIGTTSSNSNITKWYTLGNFNESKKTATISLVTSEEYILNILRTTNTAYLYIKDTKEDTLIVDALKIDLTLPPYYAFTLDKINNDYIIIGGSTSVWAWTDRATYNIENVYYYFKKITDTTLIDNYKKALTNGTSISDVLNISVDKISNVSAWNICQKECFNNIIQAEKVPKDDGVYILYLKAKDADSKTIYGYKVIGIDQEKPTVTKIEVTSPESGTYKTNQTVKIRVTFSEVITGTTVPTLKIKFGNSAERSLTNGTIKDKYIEYSYSIQDSDNGQLATVSLTGGTIKDANNNEAQLSCPIITGNTIKANTEGNITNNTENQDRTNNADKNDSNTTDKENTNTNKTDDKKTNNDNANSNNKTDTDKVDTTTATGKLPQTGVGIGLTATIVIVLAVGTFAFFKYKQLKGI